MLAASSDIPIAIVAIVFTFIYLTVRAGNAGAERKRRLDLVEKALESGAIDEATKRDLLAGVGTRLAPMKVPPLFAIGWLGMFAGIALMLVAGFWEEEVWPAGILTTVISFGVVSMPHALREMQSRRA